MNLLETLLGFARGEEDPITEMLAWFLRMSPKLRSRTLEAFDAAIRSTGARGALPRSADHEIDEPTVHTQLVAANPRGTACRYDLVCDWHSPKRVRLIVEVKVWAGLTWGVETGEEGEPDSPAHQVSRYLTVAASSPGIEAFVVVLAPYAVDLGFDNGHREGFGGQVSWQNIHDVFARAVATGELKDDRTMTTLAQNFYQLLETKKMAAPKLTFDLLTSVSRYRQFEAWARVILTQARDALVGADGELRTFYKGNSSAWQNGDYDRLGWRVWVDSKDVDAFAFIGIHVGGDTIHEEVPDLFFFVQARKGGPAHKALEAQGDEMRAAVQAMSVDGTRAHYRPGNWEVYGIRRSLVEIARAPEPADATTAFFRHCVASENGAKLLSMYVAALRAEQPSK